jgi:Xaa-Pro aminopeptidase
MRNDQRQASSQVLADAILKQGKPRRVAAEYSAYCPYLADAIDAPRVDVEPQLYFLRRRKEADELAKIKMAIAATEAMYDRARQIIRPGVNELEVFNELQSAAVERFGEMLTGTGNDYRCAARGGPPRDRKAQAGELYILDLGPAFRGYYADNCRTISVDGKPTDVQLQAWSHAVKTFDIVEKTVRPGASCKALYEEAKAWMDQSPLGRFDHHLGHGIGIFPHEAPHLNPNWDDTFESGDVFAVEPGIYGDQLAAGIRIEHNYRVTDDGVELLTDFSVEL